MSPAQTLAALGAVVFCALAIGFAGDRLMAWLRDTDPHEQEEKPLSHYIPHLAFILVAWIAVSSADAPPELVGEPTKTAYAAKE